MSNDTLPSQFSFRDFSLRQATPEDVDTLVPIINQAYQYLEEVRGEPRTSHDHLIERMSKADFFVVLDLADNIVGCFYIEISSQSLLFGLLTLIPDLRGSGLGRALITAIEQYAKALNRKTVVLDYMSISPWLKKYYESYGFSETGQIEHWGTIDLIRMSKNIQK